MKSCDAIVGFGGTTLGKQLKELNANDRTNATVEELEYVSDWGKQDMLVLAFYKYWLLAFYLHLCNIFQRKAQVTFSIMYDKTYEIVLRINYVTWIDWKNAIS